MDGRKYDWVVSLACCRNHRNDDRTGRIGLYDLRRVSNRIINEVNGISRAAYDISGKPPVTIQLGVI
ncbi:hypothetical protein ACLK11_14425 [Escherichia coli]